MNYVFKTSVACTAGNVEGQDGNLQLLEVDSRSGRQSQSSNSCLICIFLCSVVVADNGIYHRDNNRA